MTFLAVVGLVGWAFWNRFALLASSPYPMGVDGYFYAIQVRSLLEHGALHYPSAPLASWLMAPLAALTDPITGAKLGAALGSALVVWPAYVLGRRVGGARSAGFLAATLVAGSAQSRYLCTEFVKHGLGLSVAAGYLCALAWALERGPVRPGRLAWALALLIATALAHKLALVLAVLASIPPLVVAWRDADARARITRLGAALALVAVGLLVWSGAMASDSVRLLGRAFTGSWDLSLPALHVPGGPALRFQHETWIAAALALALLSHRIIAARFPCGAGAGVGLDRRCDRAFALGPALVALIAALPFLDVSDPQGLAFRLRLSSFVALALCAAALAGVIGGCLSRARVALVTVPFALAFLLARPAHSREGVVEVHPAMQAGMRALRGLVPEGDVIIVPERHLMFMAAWYSERATRLRPEPVAPARRWRLVPLAYMSDELARRIEHARSHTLAPASLVRPRGLHPGHEDGLVLVPEATWQWIVGGLSAGEARFYERWPTL